MAKEFYVIDGNDVIHLLSNCKIVQVDADNPAVADAYADDDVEVLMDNAEVVYTDSDITLG